MALFILVLAIIAATSEQQAITARQKLAPALPLGTSIVYNSKEQKTPVQMVLDKLYPGSRLLIKGKRTGERCKIMIFHGEAFPLLIEIPNYYPNNEGLYDKFRMVAFKDTDNTWPGRIDVPMGEHFKLGKEFVLVITIRENKFELNLDDSPLPDFPFQVPLSSSNNTNNLRLEGDMVVTALRFNPAKEEPNIGQQACYNMEDRWDIYIGRNWMIVIFVAAITLIICPLAFLTKFTCVLMRMLRQTRPGFSCGMYIKGASCACWIPICHENAYFYCGNGVQMEKELDNTLIDIEQLIYAGPNSRVYFGRFRFASDQQPLSVVVKVPSREAFHIDAIREEMRINAQLNHAHIVAHVGFYYDAFRDMRIVSEYMAGGNLHDHLQDRKNELSIGQMFNFLAQIADGMEYLASRRIVHRDLATRNCMLNPDCTLIKIADFGLSRRFASEDASYSCSHPMRLPLRWIAMECFGMDGQLIPYCKFSEKTDSWSFGVVIWECFARGAQPYGSVDFCEFVKGIKEREAPADDWLLARPRECPEELYEHLAQCCWAKRPEDRPNFVRIRLLLSQIWDVILSKEPDMVREMVK